MLNKRSSSFTSSSPPAAGLIVTATRTSSTPSEHLRRSSNVIGNGDFVANQVLQESVRNAHLITVMQSNDLSIILPALTDYLATAGPVGQNTPPFGSPLHLAQAFCSKHVLDQIISSFCLQQPAAVGGAIAPEPPWVNDKSSPDGETILHVAARARNIDLLELLFRVDGINDMIKNAQGKIAEEVISRPFINSSTSSLDSLANPALGSNDKVVQIFRREKQKFAAKVLGVVRNLIMNRSPYGIIEYFNKDKRAADYLASGLIDINQIVDTTTDMTILHFASREDCPELVDWALNKGADPDIKDRKGRKPIDLLPKKDGRSRDRLRTAVAAPVLFPPGASPRSGHPPAVTGVLKKWVNYSSGWRSRFFSLDNGNFSYYKSEADYPVSCRGSIATKIANIEFPDAKDKCRFDVVGKGSVRFSLQARSPADAKKWVWALMESQRWMKDNIGDTASQVQEEGGDIYATGNSDEEDYEGSINDEGNSAVSSTAASPVRLSVSITSPQISHRPSFMKRPSMNKMRDSSASAVSASNNNDTAAEYFPMTVTDDLATLAHLLQVQMEVQNRVVEGVIESLQSSNPRMSVSSTVTPITPTSNSGFLRDVDVSNLPSLMRSSMKQVGETVARILTLSEAKERKWRRRCLKSMENVKRLEQIVRGVEGLRLGDVNLPVPELFISEPLDSPGPILAGGISDRGEESDDTDMRDMADALEHADDDDDVFYDAEGADPLNRSNSMSRRSSVAHRNRTIANGASSPLASNITSGSFETVRNVTPNTSPNRTIGNGSSYSNPPPAYDQTSATASLGPANASVPLPQEKGPVAGAAAAGEPQTIFLTDKKLSTSMAGHLPVAKSRDRIPLDPNKPKPSFNAWSFIKSAIGKDLSKVTLPVFFNESLSMLQRMGEDIEFAELLSLAARTGRPPPAPGDPSSGPAVQCAKGLNLPLEIMTDLRGEEAQLVRLLLVSAYAMSNYSSTIGRTGKPFNPILGETFEIVNDEKQYRYVSEQVCHHPPISACYADSKDWTFWTEVNVKSRFWGNSLEIHPLGDCHVRLPVPADAQPAGATEMTEHYTWKKVTTTVNNLIGKLSITHLGDMVVRNWRTGEQCVLTFRPRPSSSGGSWFSWGGDSSKSGGGGSGGGGKSSSHSLSEEAASPGTEGLDAAVGEIVGVCKDRNGNVRWTLAGSWGDRLTATRVSSASGMDKSGLPRQLLLWARGPPHPLGPQLFNLTPFAMTLNELPKALMEHLPVTDSRLRLDQRAMEEGRWDDANKGKEALETIQRSRRRILTRIFEETGVPSGPERGVEWERKFGPMIPIGEPWWQPRWFVRVVDDETGEQHWAFTGEYFQHREKGDWPKWVLPVFEPPTKE